MTGIEYYENNPSWNPSLGHNVLPTPEEYVDITSTINIRYNQNSFS